MIACVDVHYQPSRAVAGCILATSWTAECAAVELVECIDQVERYQPGQFYRRELPCLLAVLGHVKEPLEGIVVDGYVWLQDEQTPGLGGHLYQALGRRLPVIGVAKTRFLSAAGARAVYRGGSRRPLHVNAAGMDMDAAAETIRTMHGAYRVPTLLRRVDQLCRQSFCQP